MSAALLVDLGSTYTKLLAVDLEREEILGRATGPSTVTTDVMIGLEVALEDLHRQLGSPPRYRYRLASSSAAGGLKMVVIGLVPDLTAEAARRAALGAGARVVGVFSHVLGQSEWDRLRRLQPDIVLLAGGTDGGERKTILANAAGLAALRLGVPVIVAGNRSAADAVLAALRGAGEDARATENVMPEIGRLNVDPAREAIRQVFIERITEAKGIKRAEAFVDGGVLMPTPTAVLSAARLLSEGAGGEEGLGDLLVVDIGGATTDVHSIAGGMPTQGGVLPKGLPEPHVTRTVEGDLGLRHNAPTILAEAGEHLLRQFVGGTGLDLHAATHELREDVERLPRTTADWALDEGLAAAATCLAVRRHAGRLEEVYTPMGTATVQYGKDLRAVPAVIGTGGVLVFGPHPRTVLAQALADPSDPLSLRPVSPALLVDDAYCLYALGLLGEVEPAIAVRLGRRHLRPVSTPAPTVAAAVG